MHLDTIFERLHLLGLREHWVPCTNEEIETLELYYQIALPSTYRDFLQTLGQGAGEFLKGSHFLYKHLPDLQIGAREILAETTLLPLLPEDAFIFFMHQGYEFMFFRLSEGNNPPVYQFHEARPQHEFVLFADSFTDYLWLVCKGIEEWQKKLQTILDNMDSQPFIESYDDEDD
ncbi:MAG: SMI1/KNR4 family protein [Candidatus Promineifilaceae bacterium]